MNGVAVSRVVRPLVFVLAATLLLAACQSAPTPAPTSAPAKPAATSAPAAQPASATAAPAAQPTQPAASQPSGQKITMKLSHQLPANHPNNVQAQAFAKEVADKSKGQMEVQIFPAAQLYKESDVIAALQRGEVEMASMTWPFWSTLVPAVLIQDLPFRFSSWDAQHAALDGAMGQILTAAMEEKGIKTLFWIDNTSIDLIGTRDRLVKLPADLKGQRLRSYSEAVSETMTVLGAAPTIMAAGDVYTALQRGTIDGLISGVSFFERKWYEVTPYITYIPFQFSTLPVQMNLAFWNKLTADQQKILRDAAKVGQDLNRKETPAQVTASYDKMKGLVKGWHEVPKGDMEAWVKSVGAMDNWYLQRAGAPGQKVLDAAKAVAR